MIEHDEDLYGRVRAGFGPVRMSDDLPAVTARGKALRTRRRAKTSVVVAVLAVALAVPVISARDSAPPIELAAWSVESSPDGVVTLTVREMVDPAGLTAKLAAAGVPARVDFGTDCGQRADGLPAIGQVVRPARNGPGDQVFRIRAAAMPAGTVLHFVGSGSPGGPYDTVGVTLVPAAQASC